MKIHADKCPKITLRGMVVFSIQTQFITLSSNFLSNLRKIKSDRTFNGLLIKVLTFFFVWNIFIEEMLSSPNCVKIELPRISLTTLKCLANNS